MQWYFRLGAPGKARWHCYLMSYFGSCLAFVSFQLMQTLVNCVCDIIVISNEFNWLVTFNYLGLEYGIYNAVNIGFGFGWCFPIRPGGNYDIILIFSTLYMIGSLWLMQQVVYTFVCSIQLENSMKWYIFGTLKLDFVSRLPSFVRFSLPYLCYDLRNNKFPKR